jgi:hypothetical protein
MSTCACGAGNHKGQGGPFAEGKALVDFVARAHGGTKQHELLSNGGLKTRCQGCGAPFTLRTFVDCCPACGGVHAVAPPRCDDAANIQFGGADYRLP